jgi:hypothetical protein
MLKFIGIFALAGSLAACASSPFSQAPVSQVAPSANQSMGPGLSHNPSECVTDEGNGRYFPCSHATN